MAVCYIVGAGDCPALPFSPQTDDLVIAADAGFVPLQQSGLRIDLTVGDFDSLGKVPSGTEIVQHPIRKDDTDMLLAAKLGLARGFRRFVLYGGLGGRRFDHTVANLQTLHYLHTHGAIGFLTAAGQAPVTVTVAGKGVYRFAPQAVGDFSVFAFGGNAVVSLRGLNYNAEQVTLSPDFPLGVSNAFTEQQAEVTVHSGAVLAVWYGAHEWLTE